MNVVYAPRMQINHKYINRSIDRWLDIHFGDTSFNGRVVIGHRKNGGGIYTMTARSLTELRPYVKMIHASHRLDYYITANTISGVTRRKDDLFGLQNIVIDIDCHDGRQPRAIAELVQAFIWRSKRDLWNTGELPSPNSIVRTGRGVQLWWAIKPVFGGKGYDKSRVVHETIKNRMMDHIEAMLGEYSEELDGLEIDRGTSSNSVGYFRLPYTYNTSAQCHSTLEILHDERYDQRELIRIVHPITKENEEQPVQQHISMKDSDRFILRNFQSTGVRRVIQLIKLRNLRDNEVGSEMRDYFNFSVYNALRITLDHHAAMVSLRAFNAGFKKPMTERELSNCISTATKKGGYKYSNTKLIELLDITPREQKLIGLLPYRKKGPAKPNASRDEARKALREDRNCKILELTGRGVSQAETARILGISKNTVGSVVKQNREIEVIEAEINQMGDESSRPNFGSINVFTAYYSSKIADTIVRNTTKPSHVEVGGLFVMPEKDSS